MTTNLHYSAILSAFGVASFTILTMIANMLSLVNNKNFSQGHGNTLAISLDRQLSVKILDEKYRELVSTAHAINAMWSKLFLWFILYWCAWMSSHLDDVMRTTNNYARVFADVAEMVAFTAAILLSAESARKVRISC